MKTSRIADEDSVSEETKYIQNTIHVLAPRSQDGFQHHYPSRMPRLAFVDTIHLPEWRYLLLKLKSWISDQGWQTLLNLSQLDLTFDSVRW
jgi:hypothetical protein